MSTGEGRSLLFVDACPRGGQSRTLMLAEACLGALTEAMPGLRTIRHTLADMDLQPSDAAWLEQKDALCDRQEWTHARLKPAVEFRQADAVLIAAPYWDLSFPAVLKTWVENIWVRNLTFVYRNDQAVGLAGGRAALYITTSGSFLAGHDWGTAYIRDVMATLGIPAFACVSAQGLDLASSDPEAILSAARTDAAAKAAWLQSKLSEA